MKYPIESPLKFIKSLLNLMESALNLTHHLVGGFKHDFYFPFHIWDVILPIDEVIFFNLVIAPPTSPLLTMEIAIKIPYVSHEVPLKSPRNRHEFPQVAGGVLQASSASLSQDGNEGRGHDHWISLDDITLIRMDYNG